MTSLANQVSQIENGFNIPKVLDWNVITDGVQGTTTGVVFPNMQMLIRQDNKLCLGVATEGYNILQNSQLWELVCEVATRSGFDAPKAGIFRGGKRVWTQIQTNYLSLNGDKIQGYATGINSFDGSVSLALGHSNTTISCQNTFYKAYRGLSKVKHTGSMQRKIEELMTDLKKCMIDEENTFNQIEKMSKISIDSKLIEQVKTMMFDLDKKLERVGDEKEVSTRTRNQIEKFEEVLRLEMQEKGESLWGLFSGVTYYHTHEYGNKNTDNMEVRLLGGVGNKDRQIFDYLGNLC
jgi:hypothetical protein